MIKKKKKEGDAGQGEPCGGHLQDQEKCIIQQDNYPGKCWAAEGGLRRQSNFVQHDHFF